MCSASFPGQLQASQQLLVVLAVLPDPGVTVIDTDCRDIVVSKARKNSKPLREEVCFKAIARSSIGKLDNHFLQDRQLSSRREGYLLLLLC